MSVVCVCVWERGGGGGKWGGGGCSPIVHVLLGGNTEEARQSQRPAGRQEGSSSVAMLLVAERVVCSIVAAPMASPAPLTAGSRYPSRPVDYWTECRGYVNGCTVDGKPLRRLLGRKTPAGGNPLDLTMAPAERYGVV